MNTNANLAVSRALLRRLRFCSLLVFCAVAVLGVRAQDSDKHPFDLPADSAETTLKLFSQQSGRGLIMGADSVAGIRTNRVKGDLTPRAAIDQMLDGTGLVATEDPKSGDFVVHGENTSPNAPGAAPATGGRPTVDEAGPGPMAPPAVANGTGEQTLRLDPFEVKTSSDTSYGALNSNSITRFNTELNKVPVTADIYTQQFIDDVGATSINAMLETYGGTGVALSNPSSDALQNQPGDRVVIGDRFTPQQISYRGLSAGNIRRDGFEGFPTNTSETSDFDIDRVELLHGPEGLLYGAGGAGGTIIADTKEAHFDQTGGRIEDTIDQYGSKRLLIDSNDGGDWVANRFAYVEQDTNTRRVNIGDNLDGFYDQLAFQLPFHTILRVEGEYTDDLSILPANGTTVNFGSTATDPRSGDRLDYLLLTNQAGAINPATGAAFSKYGAIDNGNLNWSNVDSFLGSMKQDDIQNYILTARADTVWTSWLSTNVGANFDRDTDRSDAPSQVLSAPLLNSNPNNNWGMNSSMADVLNQQLYKEFRASFLVTKDFFSHHIKTQSAGGYDQLWRGYGAIDDDYYLGDGSGNIVVNAASIQSNNLGRTTIPSQWWTVGNGPLLYPLGTYQRGQPIYVSPTTGLQYVRTEENPRSPAYLSPGNPLGDANLYELTPAVTVNKSVSGVNQGGYGEQVKTWGYYFANYTSWWDDWVNSLVGYRLTETHTHIPNGSSNIYGANYVEPSAFSDPSYNLGLDGRITDWLRWFGDISATYNDGVGQDDPLGNPPPPTYSHGWEAGLKFTPLGSRISGSVEYYRTSDHDDNINYGGSVINSINPAGLNGTYTGPAGRNSFVNLDEKSSGMELTLTAQPTPNWRVFVHFTQSEGTILTTKKYGILYNDQFYTDGKGDVTYADGTPFLVPIDADASTLTKLAAQTNSATFLAAIPTQQLTTAMIGNPSSPYYAWAGNPVNLNGQIDSGIAGTPSTPVGLALRYLTHTSTSGATVTPLTGALGLPFSAIQYAWPDPGSTGGTYTVSEAGDPTVGYPEFAIAIVNNYEIPNGWFRGAGLGVDLTNAWRNQTYVYIDPSGTRPLFSAPELGWQINLHPYYKRKFGRIFWRTQVDIFNLTNHYLLTLAPNNGTGYNTPQNIGVLWTGQPRRIQWTNIFAF